MIPVQSTTPNLHLESEFQLQHETKTFIHLLLSQQNDVPVSTSEVHWYKNHYCHGGGGFDDILWSSTNGANMLAECIQILQSNFDSDKWGTGIRMEKELMLQNLLKSADCNIDSFNNSYEHLETLQIVGITRLIQILLHKGVQLFQSQTPNVNSNCSMALNPSMAINTAGTLINNLTKKLCDAIKCIDRSNNNFISQSAQFYLTLLSRPINHIACKTKILANVWRSICDLAVTLNKWRLQITTSILSDIVRYLIQYLDEGNKFLLQIISNLRSTVIDQNNMTCSDIVNTAAIQQLAKLHKFFLLRLHQVITITTDGFESGIIDSNTHILNHLVQFKGLIAMVSIMSEQLDSPRNEWEGQIQPLFQIIPKVDQSIEKLLFATPSSGHGKIINQLNLTMLIAMDDEKAMSTENGVAVHQHLIDSFWLGKLQVLTTTLKGILGMIQDCNDNMDVLVSICERLLNQILPNCHGWLTIQTSKVMFDTNCRTTTNAILISDSIHTIVDCLLLLKSFEIAAQNGCRSKVDWYLVYWLSPCPTSCRKADKIYAHSFTRELTLGVVYSYIIRLAIHCEQKQSFSIIRTLGKLAFDPRTEKKHRANICIMLFRLLTLCESLVGVDEKYKISLVKVVHQTELLLTKKFLYFLHGIFDDKQNEKGQKRKLDDDFASVFVSYDGFEVVIPLLEVIASRESFWSVHDRKLLTLFFRLLQLKDSEDQSLLLKLFDNNPCLVQLTTVILRGALLLKLDFDSDLNIQNLQEFIVLGMVNLCSYHEGNQTMPTALVECLDEVIVMSTKGLSSNLWLSLMQILSYFSAQNKQEHQSSIQNKFSMARILSKVPLAITNDVPDQLLSVRFFVYFFIGTMNQECTSSHFMYIRSQQKVFISKFHIIIQINGNKYPNSSYVRNGNFRQILTCKSSSYPSKMRPTTCTSLFTMSSTKFCI